MSPTGKACETVASVGHRPVPLGWFSVSDASSHLFTAKKRRWTVIVQCKPRAASPWWSSIRYVVSEAHLQRLHIDSGYCRLSLSVTSIDEQIDRPRQGQAGTARLMYKVDELALIKHSRCDLSPSSLVWAAPLSRVDGECRMLWPQLPAVD